MGLITTTDTPVCLGPFILFSVIMASEMKFTCRDDRPWGTELGIVLGHGHHTLFELLDTGRGLVRGQVRSFFSVPVGGRWTWTKDNVNESSIWNCSFEFNIVLRLSCNRSARGP